MKKNDKLDRLKTDGQDASIGRAVAREGLPLRTIDARDLFGKEVEVGIVHHESLYRLRITRAGKLILNK
jgi:hemin uptake protein HemP